MPNDTQWNCRSSCPASSMQNNWINTYFARINQLSRHLVEHICMTVYAISNITSLLKFYRLKRLLGWARFDLTAFFLSMRSLLCIVTPPSARTLLPISDASETGTQFSTGIRHPTVLLELHSREMNFQTEASIVAFISCRWNNSRLCLVGWTMKTERR